MGVFWNTRIDKLYLDTTYCRPEYDFPSQSDVITRTVEMVGEFVANRPDTVVMVL
jgi:DNA cross-link repair 1A protein